MIYDPSRSPPAMPACTAPRHTPACTAPAPLDDASAAPPVDHSILNSNTPDATPPSPVASTPLPTWVDALPLLLKGTDAHGTILAWNQTAEQVTGYSLAALHRHPHLEQHFLPLTAPTTTPLTTASPPARATASPSPPDARPLPSAPPPPTPSPSWEQRVLHPDGSVKSLRWEPLPEFPLDVPGVVLWEAATDLTAKREAQRALIEQDESQHRSFLANELHDHVCQDLVALGYALDLIEMHPYAPNLQAAALVQVRQQVKDILATTRRLAHGFMQTEHMPHSLTSGLAALTHRMSQLFGVHCVYIGEASDEVLDRQVAHHLYRIAQEAVTNALKHACPRSVIVHFQLKPDTALLTITNDGLPFTDPTAAPPVGLGLRAMHYRAQRVLGTLTITRDARGRTVVTCRVPAHAWQPPPDLAP